MEPGSTGPTDKYERELELLINRLPANIRQPIIWLRRPTSRWARLPAGALLMVGGFFGFLPILGLWMLPLGLALIAEDLPILRQLRNRVLDRLSKRRGGQRHDDPPTD